ncbi:PTH1 family peptidyl-tRNA hydrolase [Gracilibacillus halotolerans]|uniref:Peptidyl-tRNA hydrolase n=1 Tax=Gracilibacillus halotolerans TaxID=74386 RepID=A0A841RQ23_9BACI|nr:aminoacyl-tRNA hydrolase [Gracilibacillus halotolerans]MBB6513962.1 PTH1 family peptidyl-tRNA hydrolase [Gracilibacillus halotolerans]
MKVIAGLGNPGKKYANTRHNIGFLVIDELLSRNGWSLSKRKFNGLYTEELVHYEKMIIVQPQTFMNLSGECIRPLMDFYQLEPSDIAIVYDDLDLPLGKVKLRQTGGHGGHNGIRSLISHLDTKQFNRIRIGIGRPDTQMPVIDYVLGKFSKEERKLIDPAIQKAADAIEEWASNSFDHVMNKYN